MVTPGLNYKPIVDLLIKDAQMVDNLRSNVKRSLDRHQLQLELVNVALRIALRTAFVIL